jgi:hypothetical protein
LVPTLWSVIRSNAHRSSVSPVSCDVMTSTSFCTVPPESQSATARDALMTGAAVRAARSC